VDILRSAYQVSIRAFSDDPEKVTQIRWYRARPKAQMMPWASSFGSRVWEERDGEGQEAIGEVYGTSQWRGGQIPSAMPTGGLCGSERQWQQGATAADPIPATWPGTNIPVCCSKPERQDLGGIALGGEVASIIIEKPEGGIALGGEVASIIIEKPEGGIALGGEVASIIIEKAEGGIALGGEVASIIIEKAEGGVALGGLDWNSFDNDATKGIALGGDAVVHVRKHDVGIPGTYDLYRPFGAATPTYTGVDCTLFEDVPTGRGQSPINTVVWTHYLETDADTDILDGCTRTDAVNTLNYADGDEIRIPSSGTTRYVVVFVSQADPGDGQVTRAYLMRHSA